MQKDPQGVYMKRLTLISTLTLAAAGFASAQEVSRFSFVIDGGFTQPVGNTGRHLDEGWNIGTGAGVNFGKYVGAMVDVNYNSFGINSPTLANIGVPGVTSTSSRRRSTRLSI